MSKTPTLDKLGLHPIGGYCTCFSSPYQPCNICNNVNEQQKRWAKLTKKQKVKASQEIDRAYPSTSNQDGR